MTPCKKLEIVIGEVYLEKLLAIIQHENAPGFSVVPGVRGAGDRGEQKGDALTGLFVNCLVIVVCDEEMVSALTPKITPLLKRYGGICLCSDVEQLEH